MPRSSGPSGQPPDILAAALGFNINRLATLFRRRLTEVLRPWSLTPERWQVLAAIVTADVDGPLTQSDVAQLILKDRHTVSRMLDGMEREGWIERHDNPDDARAFWIKPTARARREFPRVRDTLYGGFDELLQQMPDRDRARLLKLLQQMVDIFETG